MTSRPYTGNTDGNHPTERPGTKRFVEFMEYLFGMKSLGIYANRPMRGSANLSVHATWRAVDLKGKGTAKQNADARKAMVEFHCISIQNGNHRLLPLLLHHGEAFSPVVGGANDFELAALIEPIHDEPPYKR